ncbi:MAG: GxxExxY protein [Bacteroidales bacterium]|jgi:GxxExxY protein|nr:GxxExxY protein [Bacteroidales bacterium]MEE0918104.1 GxxExxY protein [Bacteroidales bacterium]MEE1143122.1 GxxExxY protein [Bacteroidales bacterium]
MTQDKLIYEVIGASMEVYNVLGPGLLESVYEKALLYELKLRGLKVSSQIPVNIEYKGNVIGSDLRLDIIVEDILIVELKSVESLLPVHFKQIRTYMRLLNKSMGLLINFNVSDFKNGYKVIK